MKRICLFVFIGLVFGCHSKILTESDDGKTFYFKTGHEFILELFENPTTGYRWKIETDPNPQFIVEQISDDFQVDNTKLLGSGGRRIISFRTVNQGTVKLQAFHQRPWENNDTSDPNLEVIIVNQ